ncbi:acetylcholinesterase-like isoform X2 [Convolutriloba macropyga]|uniref:acetylcholinesterase-like isoform X2 n=1 Tax=Convolutriloba macropyga TaxID=536237 RepID=UPI003F526EA9
MKFYVSFNHRFQNCKLYLIIVFFVLNKLFVLGQNGGSYRFVKFIDKIFGLGHITGSVKEYRYEGKSYLVQEYLGIPYAEPPVGDLRFKYPTRRYQLSDTGSLNATRFGPACMQIADTTFNDEEEKIRQAADMWNFKTEYQIDEDCLTLNIWAPYNPNKRDTKYPVMLWIYGGGFFSGTSHLDVYNGYRLTALENVVVVTFNYRLGLFGFLYLNSYESPGNMGLYDQLVALSWVKENIAAFGGDMERITLFGESAGSASVGFHMLSPLSNHLFTNGIMQSGSPTAPWALMSRDEMLDRSLGVAKRLSCYNGGTDRSRVAACLRRLSLKDILTATASLYSDFAGKNKNRWLDFPVAPIVDNKLIPMDPLTLLRTGNFKKVPLMIGSTSNEGSFWLLYYRPYFNVRSSNLLTSVQYEESLDTIFNFKDKKTRDAIKFVYRNWTDPHDQVQNRLAIDKATGEYNFACPCNHFAEFYSAIGRQRVYMYYLNHRSSTEGWPEWMGAIHGADCEWVFGKFLDTNNTPQEKRMTRNIMWYWANFARTGNPNRESLFNFDQEYWPRWELNGQKLAVLNTNYYLTQGVGPAAKRCAFWNKMEPKFQKSELCDMTANSRGARNSSAGSFYQMNSDLKTRVNFYIFVICTGILFYTN